MSDTSGSYQWLGPGLRPVCELALARVGWAGQRRTSKVPFQAVAPAGRFSELRAARWLDKVEGAVSGAGGHNATFCVACKLTHHFGLDFDAALRLLLGVFNPRCQPPWSEAELMHKVEDALKKRG